MDDDRIPATSVPIRPAATVMLLRDGEDGLEVFMLQRTRSAAFARGQYVFPGGKVDDADHADELEAVCDRLDDASASARLGMGRGGLAWLVAAVRECFEEAGVLLARRHDESEIVRFDSPEVEARLNDARHAIHDGTLTLRELCAAEGLLLLVDRIHLVDHWLTPVGERRRFDTRFFLAAAPDMQEPLHDDKETVASLWVRPGDALAMVEARELGMLPPTIASMRALADVPDVATALDAAKASGVPPVRLPRLVLDDDERVVGIRLQHEDGYDELPVPEYVIGQPR